jgi:uncharacterized protein involved in outer membrane biogenesis
VRRAAVIVFVLLAVFVAILLALPYIVSLERFRVRVVGAAEAALHRKVEIQALKLEIWSGLGAGLEGVTIHNPPGWESPAAVKAGTISLKVAFWPLLSKRIEITKAVLRNAEVVVERNAKGNLNFGAALSSPKPEAGGALAPRAAAPPAPAAAAAFLVSRVEIRGLRFVFIDRKVSPGAAVTIPIDDIQGEILSAGPAAATRIELSARLLTEGSSRNLRVSGSAGPPVPGRGFAEMPLQLEFEGTGVLLGRLHPYFGSANEMDLGRLAAKGSLTGSLGGPHAVLADITLASDTFAAKGKASVKMDFGKSDFDVTADLEKLSARRGPDPLLEAGETHVAVAAHGTAPITGSVRIPGGRLQKLVFEDLDAGFSYAAGVLSLTPRLKALGGSLAGTVTSELAGAHPTTRLDIKIANVKAQGLVSELTSVKDVLLGSLDAGLELTVKGLTWETASKTAEGQGELRIGDVELKTFQLMPEVARALSSVGAVAGFTVPPGLESTKFDALSTRYRIADGHVLTPGLTLTAKDVTVTADGALGFDRSVAYRGRVVLSGETARALGKTGSYLTDEQGRVAVPFEVSGTVSAPKVSIAQDQLRELAQRALSRLAREEIKGDLGAAVGGLLDSFLRPPSPAPSPTPRR